MSADGGTLTTTGYIEHHLTNLAVCADSAKVDGVCTGFWTFHLDTLLVSGILGLVVFGLMAMLASKATSGVPFHDCGGPRAGLELVRSQLS